MSLLDLFSLRFCCTRIKFPLATDFVSLFSHFIFGAYLFNQQQTVDQQHIVQCFGKGSPAVRVPLRCLTIALMLLLMNSLDLFDSLCLRITK